MSVIGVFQDITNAHAREQALRHTADTDALTGLPNRAYFEKRLFQALMRVQQTSAPAYLLVEEHIVATPGHVARANPL
jgi:GGDEF domain-containing protein